MKNPVKSYVTKYFSLELCKLNSNAGKTLGKIKQNKLNTDLKHMIKKSTKKVCKNCSAANVFVSALVWNRLMCGTG